MVENILIAFYSPVLVRSGPNVTGFSSGMRMVRWLKRESTSYPGKT
jgi:hypothetical protein